MTRLNLVFTLLLIGIVGAPPAEARPYYYPGVRYLGLAASSMGGVNLPLSDEVGNALFNNPAALARNTKFKAEYLNLNLDANSNLLAGLGLESTKMTSLGGMTTQLNQEVGKTYGAGLANLTALSWGGFAVGLLLQERVRAQSDGTNVQYDTLTQFVPAMGYGLALARGVVRFGYSVHYVNHAYGLASVPSNSSASFLSNLNEGRGLSHNASFNIMFPYTYLPTFSVLARNIFGTHFVSGSLLPRATSPLGITSDEQMSVDAAFNFMIRLSGTTKSFWYFQYDDLTGGYAIPFLEKIHLGVDLGISNAVDIRAGLHGTKPSLGIGFKSGASEINVGWYYEPNPLASDYWDSRYGLQYKLFFQDKNTRDRDGDTGSSRGPGR